MADISELPVQPKVEQPSSPTSEIKLVSNGVDALSPVELEKRNGTLETLAAETPDQALHALENPPPFLPEEEKQSSENMEEFSRSKESNTDNAADKPNEEDSIHVVDGEVILSDDAEYEDRGYKSGDSYEIFYSEAEAENPRASLEELAAIATRKYNEYRGLFPATEDEDFDIEDDDNIIPLSPQARSNANTGSQETAPSEDNSYEFFYSEAEAENPEASPEKLFAIAMRKYNEYRGISSVPEAEDLELEDMDDSIPTQETAHEAQRERSYAHSFALREDMLETIAKVSPDFDQAYKRIQSDPTIPETQKLQQFEQLVRNFYQGQAEAMMRSDSGKRSFRNLVRHNKAIYEALVRANLYNVAMQPHIPDELPRKVDKKNPQVIAQQGVKALGDFLLLQALQKKNPEQAKQIITEIKKVNAKDITDKKEKYAVEKLPRAIRLYMGGNKNHLKFILQLLAALGLALPISAAKELIAA